MSAACAGAVNHSGNLGDILPTDQRRDQAAFVDLRDGGRRWSFAELDAAAGAVAAGLQQRGYARGDRIALLLENSAEFMQAYLGIMRAGMTAVPVNFRLSAETIAFILRDCTARAAIVDGARKPLVPTELPTFSIDVRGADGFAALLDRSPSTIVAPDREELAEILYTSGSTGRPKGVPLSHAGQLWALQQYLGLAAYPAERTLIVAPTYHMNGLFYSTVALASGQMIISLPRFEARTYLKAVAAHGCVLLSGIPTMFALIARETELISRLDLRAVRRIFIGSAPLTEALAARVSHIFPNAQVQNGYGTTEAGPAIFGPHPDGLARPILSIGYPLDSIQWRLGAGRHSNEGVFELKTPAMLRSYLNLPGATSERIRDGWYVTGDIMRRDAQGFFYFAGRADDMFVCGGENIYPIEIERLLERHPSVIQAAVVAVPDEIKGEIPIAFVVCAPGAVVTPEELKRFALRNGPAYAHPRAVVMVEDVPLAGTHKVDRRQLVERAREVARTLVRDAMRFDADVLDPR